MTISRIIIASTNNYDEKHISELLTDYGIAPEDMISVVHDNGSIYLYFYTWN
jgi:hypothetical protein